MQSGGEQHNLWWRDETLLHFFRYEGYVSNYLKVLLIVENQTDKPMYQFAFTNWNGVKPFMLYHFSDSTIIPLYGNTIQRDPFPQATELKWMSVLSSYQRKCFKTNC